MTNALPPRQDNSSVLQPRRASGALRIGVNLVALNSNGGGMRQYVLQLLPWMLRQSEHHLVLFYHWRSQPTIAILLRRLRPSERNRVRCVFIVDQDEIFGHADDFDVYFCPLNCLAPDLLDRPTLAMLPDIQDHFFPHYFSEEQRSLRDYFYPQRCRAVTTLLTISQFSRQTICDAFELPPEKVRAIHLAANDEVREARPEWPDALGDLPGRFLFYPANLYPHKNHKALLDAVRLLKERGLDCACLMTGQPSQPGIDIDAEIRARGLQEQARWLGHVSAGALRHLYENAVALCFPSEFEGFGMPLVEAMECGCPVIATPAACIPEIVGDAAMLIDGTPEALADAVARLLRDREARRDLIARGRARARRFHPSRLAQETLEAIEEAVVRFWEPPSSSREAQAITYVVHPRAGGRDLIETLSSLAFEVRDHDEILVLAERDSLMMDARILCENLRIVRFLPPDAWLDEVHHDYLFYLQEGGRISEGATQAALAEFAEDSDCQAVVGEVLGRDDGEKLARVAYMPPQMDRPGRVAATAGRDAVSWRVEVRGQMQEPPAAAVFWRTAHLRRQRRLLAEMSWPIRALEMAEAQVRVCSRTFASIAAPYTMLRLRGRIRPMMRRVALAVRWLPHRLRSHLGQWTRKLGLRPERPVLPTTVRLAASWRTADSTAKGR